MLQRRSVPRNATTVKGDLATYFTKFSFVIHCNSARSVKGDLATHFTKLMLSFSIQSARCCNSFSTRPGKEGKKDLCVLDTIFENQVS